MVGVLEKKEYPQNTLRKLILLFKIHLRILISLGFASLRKNYSDQRNCANIVFTYIMEPMKKPIWISL